MFRTVMFSRQVWSVCNKIKACTDTLFFSTIQIFPQEISVIVFFFFPPFLCSPYVFNSLPEKFRNFGEAAIYVKRKNKKFNFKKNKCSEPCKKKLKKVK